MWHIIWQIIQSFHVCQYCAIEGGLEKNCQFCPPDTSGQVKHVSVCNYVLLESCSSKCRCLIVCSKEAVPAMFFQPDWLFLRAAFSYFLNFSFLLLSACCQALLWPPFRQILPNLSLGYEIQHREWRNQGWSLLCGRQPWYSVYMTHFFLLYWNLRETAFLIEVSISECELQQGKSLSLCNKDLSAVTSYTLAAFLCSSKSGAANENRRVVWP